LGTILNDPSMKEATRRKLLGNRLYSIYRRIRYLRYLRKKKKERRYQARNEKKLEEKQFRDSLRALSASERISERQKAISQKRELKKERAQVKRDLKARLKIARQQEKKKTQTEKIEKKQERQEIRRVLREKNQQERLIEIDRKKKLKDEKRRYRRKKKQLRPYLIRRRTRAFLYGIRSINRKAIGGWFKWLGVLFYSRTQRRSFAKIFLNSVFLFILSYQLIYLLGQLITVWAATTFDYKVLLFPYKIFYNIDSDQWTPDTVKILYSIIPFTGLILGSICMIIYSNIRNHSGIFKLFYLWGFVHGMVMFFGSTLMGALLNQGFGWVLAYMYYRDTGKMIFSIIAIFSLVSIGGAIARSFLISGNAYFNYVDRENRRFLFFSQVLFPGIIGTMAIGILKIPPDPYFMGIDEYLFEISKIGTFLLLLIPMALTFKTFGETYFDEEPRRIRLRWEYLLFAAILVTAQMYFLSSGLPIEVSE
jgi:hypothetical protein